MRFLTLANPAAASGRAARMLPAITGRFTGTPHAASGYAVDSPSRMRSRILDARREGFEALILVGGDGTLHQALPAIRDADLPFALVPLGRGNDFARNIGVGSRDWMGWNLQAQPTCREIDLPSVNGVPFGSIACAGFDATVNRLARAHPHLFHGRVGYVLCVLAALREVRPFPARIVADGAEWSGRLLMVAVANGPCYGGGMRIAPAAVMDDGRLDVCIVEEISRRVLVSQFPRVYRGTHVGHPSVHLLAGRTVEITTDAPQDVYADGEYATTLPAVCEVGTRRIRVLSFPGTG